MTEEERAYWQRVWAPAPELSDTDVAQQAAAEIKERIRLVNENMRETKYVFANLTNPDTYNLHEKLLIACANSILAQQGRTFIKDEHNSKVIEYLLHYFNNSEYALQTFPNRGHSLSKSILLCGSVGVGKTLLMDSFALYLQQTKNPRQFIAVSQTQMLNYYKQHNTLDLYTYNESGAHTFEGSPYNLCVNDLGLDTQKFYGQDTKAIIDEFIYARYELWTNKGVFTHLTSNLTAKDIRQQFSDEQGRLTDRFKMFNFVPLDGTSRR